MFPCGLRHYRNLREYLGYVKGEPIVRLAIKCPDCGFIFAPMVLFVGSSTVQTLTEEEVQRQVLDHHERDCPAHARVIQKGDAE